MPSANHMPRLYTAKAIILCFIIALELALNNMPEHTGGFLSIVYLFYLPIGMIKSC